MLIVLIALAPWIASLAPVRSFVVARLNAQLNGRVEVGSYSLGWFSRTQARDIKIYDTQGMLAMEIDEVDSPISLSDLIRGNLALGETNVVLNLTRIILKPDGTPELLDILPKSDVPSPPSDPAPSPAPSPDKPTKAPDIRGTLNVLVRGGTIEGPPVPLPIHLGQSTATVTLDGSAPIAHALKLQYRLGDGATATIESAGTVQPYQNGYVDIPSLAADLAIKLRSVDAAASSVFIASTGEHPLRIRGNMDGDIDLKLAGLSNINSKVAITIHDPWVGGGPLTTDRLATRQIQVAANIAAVGEKPVVTIRDTSISMPEGAITLDGRVPQEVIDNLIAGNAPGGQGELKLTIDFPGLARFIDQLPATLRLAEGVRMSEARFQQTTQLTFEPARILTQQQVSLSGRGTRNGQAVAIPPVSVRSGATLIPRSAATPDLRDLSLKATVATDALTITAQGQTIAQLALDLQADLAKLTREVRQVVDLGPLEARGSVVATVRGTGDPTVPGSTVELTVQSTSRDVVVRGIGELPPIEQPLTDATITAGFRTAATPGALPEIIDKLTVKLSSLNAQQQPVLSATVTANQIAMNTRAIGSVMLQAESPDLPAAVRLLDPFVPAIRASGLTVSSGQLYVNTAGSCDPAAGAIRLSQPLELSVPNLTVSVTDDAGTRRVLNRERLSVLLDGEAVAMGDDLTAVLRRLRIDTSSGMFRLESAGNTPIRFVKQGERMSAEGEVTALGNLEPLMRVVAAFTGKEALPYTGRFNLRQSVRTDGNQIIASGSLPIENLTVADAANPSRILHREPRIELVNDIVFDSANSDLTVRSLTLKMPETRAIELAVSGRITDLQKQRRFDGLQVIADYDLERAWTIVRPFMPETMKADTDRAVMAGKHRMTIPVTGSFPAIDPQTGRALAFHESIRTVQTNTIFKADRFEMFGLNISNFELPLTLVGGQVQLIYAGRSGAERLPPPARVNEGTLNLAGIVVDLSAVNPTLSIGRNQPLLRRVRLTPVLAEKLGRYAGVLFADVTAATGLLDVTVERFDRVPITDLARAMGDQNRVVLSISDLRLDGGFPSLLASAVQQIRAPGGGIVGLIKDAAFQIHNGVAYADLTLAIGADQIPIRYTGGVNVTTLGLVDVNLNIAPQLFGWRDLVKVAPGGINVPVAGTLTDYRMPDIGTIIQRTLLQGGGGGGSANPVEGWIDLLRRQGRNDNDNNNGQPRR